METAILWFRQDLRLEDNPALAKALESGRRILPLYIHAPDEAGTWAPGGAASWWLHHALEDLASRLGVHGLPLILRHGESKAELLRLVEQSGAAAVYWNRCYEPWRMRIDSVIKKALKESGVEAWSGNAALLREPWEVSTQAGSAYKVFTPYSKACAGLKDPGPVEVAIRSRPGRKTADEAGGFDPASASVELGELGLLPDIPWDSGLRDFWEPTRAGGLKRLKGFLDETSRDYGTNRDFPAVDGTSRLSPYLHFGQVGPREVARAIRGKPTNGGLETFYNELVWREFAYHVLYHFPDTPESPLQPRFKAFPWKRDKRLLAAWRRGRTGYPIVDAGMRQLWETGWMHNRVRMIVGSFLVKHLLHSWEDGAAWFWDTLVDADLASNTLGWQWAGGCGADAAPYFRIFNPITQGGKFDPEGDYTRQYVPELKDVPNGRLFSPWEMSADEQEAANCVIGRDYPEPVVGHKPARERALEAFASIKEESA